MSDSKQKLVYENRLSLGVGQQITLTAAQTGLVLQNQRPARITQVSVGQGLEYEIDSVTQAVTITNPKNQAVTNAHINITAQHSIEFKPEDEAAPPAPAPAPAPASAIRGKEERTFAVVEGNGNIIDNAVLPWEDQGESTLPVGVIAWGAGAETGIFRLNLTGLYQISVLASVSTTDDTVLTAQLVRDPAGAGAGTVIEQASVESVPKITVGNAGFLHGKIVLQEIVEIDGDAPAADRTFITSISSLVATTITRGFGNEEGTKVGNIIIEKL